MQAIGEEAVLSLEDEAPVEAEIKSDEIEAVDKGGGIQMYSVFASTVSAVTFNVPGPLRDTIPVSGVVSTLSRRARPRVWALQSRRHEGAQRMPCRAI